MGLPCASNSNWHKTEFYRGIKVPSNHLAQSRFFTLMEICLPQGLERTNHLLAQCMKDLWATGLGEWYRTVHLWEWF